MSAPEFLHYATHGDDDAQGSGALCRRNLAKTVADSATGERQSARAATCGRGVLRRARRRRSRARARRREAKGCAVLFLAAILEPHAPFNAPKRYWDLYDRANLPPLDAHNARRRMARRNRLSQQQRSPRPAGKARAAHARSRAEMRPGYFANISYMDAQLGKVLDALDASGVADRQPSSHSSPTTATTSASTRSGQNLELRTGCARAVFQSASGMKPRASAPPPPLSLLDLFHAHRALRTAQQPMASKASASRLCSMIPRCA